MFFLNRDQLHFFYHHNITNTDDDLLAWKDVNDNNLGDQRSNLLRI